MSVTVDQALLKLARLSSSVRAVRNLYRSQPGLAASAVAGLKPQLEDALDSVRRLEGVSEKSENS